MDSQEEVSERSNKKGLHIIILRCSVALVFAVASFLSLSFLVGFAAIFIGDLSVNSPISVPSQCKIVSSSVDLRSSKVCELGLLNYKAKHVVYPFERKKFRCRYDYYWASIFKDCFCGVLLLRIHWIVVLQIFIKVQYKDHSSGQMRFALAEAPNEALPLDCRPNFGAAWLTKDKFKVNETYDCWYTSGFSKVDIYYDNIFSCQAKDPSAFEMIKRYTILSMRILGSWFTSKRRVTFLKWETIAGVISGISTSLISITLFRILHQMKSWLPQMRPLLLARFKRACFVVAYFSIVGWLAVWYGKRLGFPNIFTLYQY